MYTYALLCHYINISLTNLIYIHLFIYLLIYIIYKYIYNTSGSSACNNSVTSCNLVQQTKSDYKYKSSKIKHHIN